MENNYVKYLNIVSEYSWKHAYSDIEYIRKEKLFINECLELIDLSIFPSVSVEYINETRKIIISSLETLNKKQELLQQRAKEFHYKIWIEFNEKKTTIQLKTWDAIFALFPNRRTASGDPLIECFAESITCDFNINEEVIAALLYKYFKNIIDSESEKISNE